MGTYKEFLEQMTGRATTLEQKGRQLNGKLKRAISSLSHDPKPSSEGPLSLDDLKSMSEMIREVRNHTLLSRMNSLIQTMVKADRELASLDDQINQDILAIHSSIMDDGRIPPAEAERLIGLFSKWQTTSAEIESAHHSLSTLAERLDGAIGAADVLESASIIDSLPPSPAETGPVSEKNGTVEKEMRSETVVCTEQELIELKNLLVSIMAAYLNSGEFSFELPYCCAKIAACKLARIQSPRPIRYHRKPRIKHAVRAMERKLEIYRVRGEETNQHLALFSSLVKSCRSAYLQIPEDVRKSEPMNISRYNGLQDSIAGLMEFFELRPMIDMEVKTRNKFSELLRRATGYDRVFLLELLGAFVDGGRLTLTEADPENAIKEPAVRQSLILIMQATDLQIFYTREWVAATLHRFSMDDYALLIPSMNFAHEYMGVKKADSECQEDMLSTIAKMAMLIR